MWKHCQTLLLLVIFKGVDANVHILYPAVQVHNHRGLHTCTHTGTDFFNICTHVKTSHIQALCLEICARNKQFLFRSVRKDKNLPLSSSLPKFTDIYSLQTYRSVLLDPRFLGQPQDLLTRAHQSSIPSCKLRILVCIQDLNDWCQYQCCFISDNSFSVIPTQKACALQPRSLCQCCTTEHSFFSKVSMLLLLLRHDLLNAS